MSKGIGCALKIPPHVRVLRSLSVDPFYNIALEDFIFQKNKFTSHPIILFWQNSPCVVIGRFQNPWKEANISFLKKSRIPLARRNSGGGSVFHDLGNCNITVFSDRKSYNRIKNLELVCQVLRKYFSLSCVVTDKLDIAYEGFKVSGTAARVLREKAYHHFTLLLSSNVQSLRTSLRSPLHDIIKTNATPSLPSPTINLSTVNSLLNPISFYQAYSDEILADNNVVMDIPSDHKEILSINKFKSWNWVFGNTPKFILTPNANIELTVEKGVISGLEGDVAGLFKPLLQARLSFREFLPRFLTLKHQCTNECIQNILDNFHVLIQNLPEN